MDELILSLTTFQASEVDYGLDIDATDHGRAWGHVERQGAGFRLVIKADQEARDHALYRITSLRDILLDNAADQFNSFSERGTAAARGRSMELLTRALIDAAGGLEAFSPDFRRWARY